MHWLTQVEDTDDDEQMPAPAGGDEEVPKPLDFVQEFLARHEQWDRNGFLWGKDGHWPLFAIVGRNRAYSQNHEEQAKIKEEKRKVWDKGRNGTNWPWWIEYKNEPAFWRDESRGGGGWKGDAWRNTRDEWLAYDPDALAEYELPWVEAYGEDAMEECLAFVYGSAASGSSTAPLCPMPTRPPPRPDDAGRAASSSAPADGGRSDGGRSASSHGPV